MNSSHGYVTADISNDSDDSSDDNDILWDGYAPNSHLNATRSRLSSESDTDCHQPRASFDVGTDENDSLSEQEATDQPPNKKQKQQAFPMDGYSNASHRIMQKMGYQADMGLGASGQGRLEPIEAFEQKGRRGLGMHADKLDAAGDEFDATKEHVQLRETAEWLINSDENLDYLSREDMDSWLVVAKKKLIIDDETRFCDPDVLADVLKSKTIFDEKESDEKMRKARTRSNPFEMIGRGIFLNRAAMKMANMDARLEFMFTNPVDEHGNPLVREDDLLYFADVCAGPGGFSEYVLWRKGWNAKGFGFTLRNENDFKFDEFLAGHPETFDAYYGCKDDGNIYDPENIESFTRYVLSQTGTGVHFMMADGGFSVEKQENIQEILCKQLYLCQCLVALSIVREKGHFVVKLFDLFTPFSVGLVYLMYKCFQEICILKPNTSRPANSERYLICKWKLSNTHSVERFLFDINAEMWANKTDTDTLEIVSYDVLRSDDKFFNFIVESNNQIGRAQCTALLKIANYLKNKDLKDTRQGTICTDCLAIWHVPHEVRKKRTRSPDELFSSLMGTWLSQKDFLNNQENILKNTMNLKKIFQDISSWLFIPIETVESEGKNVRTFFMSQGRLDVLMYKSNGSWSSVPSNLYIEMTPNTLIYAEIVTERCGENRMQKTSYGLHIIDGIVLGGVDIRNYRLTKRLKLCQKFARSLNKPNRANPNFASISCKTMYPLTDFRKFFDRLQYRMLKDSKPRLTQSIRTMHDTKRFYVPRGLLFFNEIKPNLQREFSKTHQKTYFFDQTNKHTFFLDQLPNPDTIYGSFKSTYTKRHLWPWEVITQVDEHFNNETERVADLLYRADMNQLIDDKILENDAKFMLHRGN